MNTLQGFDAFKPAALGGTIVLQEPCWALRVLEMQCRCDSGCRLVGCGAPLITKVPDVWESVDTCKLQVEVCVGAALPNLHKRSCMVNVPLRHYALGGARPGHRFAQENLCLWLSLFFIQAD